MNRSWIRLLLVVCTCSLACPDPAEAAPSITDALKPTPVQPSIDYDQPDQTAQATCTIKAEKVNGVTAWVIRNSQGQILRQFSDFDGDNVVDTWGYFRDGLEVYRDIDENRNGQADQHRWFHSAGSRWGINTDEDKQGSIDRWKLISAEEAAEEVVAAVSTNNPKRFQALLLSAEELTKLGLSPAQSEQLNARLKLATDKFQQLVDGKKLSADSQFTDFGGLRPGIVPSGTRGSTKDLLVYENVWAMIHQGDEHQQLQLGTMINFNGAWKLIDGPTIGTSKDVAGGFFFGPSGSAGEASAIATGAEPTEEMQKILAALEKLDQQISTAAGEERVTLLHQRADLLARLAENAQGNEERVQWYKQLADSVSASAQDGTYPEGVALLQEWQDKFADQEEDELVAYFQFQRMLAEYYGVTLAQEGVDAAKAQSEWLAALETFLDEHPQSEHAAEALRQLAMASEIAGEDETAIKWYQRIVDQFPDSVHTAMSKGAITRLNSEGHTIQLKGIALQGGNVDLASLRGKAVVIQYWTTSCDVCTKDHELLGNLYKKYGGTGLEIIGVNLDFNRANVVAYLEKNRLPWKQLYEAGGFDGRLASDLGVVTVPLILLVGPDGKVISSNIRAEEIEAELKKLANPGAQATNPPLKR
jgi:thiol-disulfide isomerase/thioredoxin